MKAEIVEILQKAKKPKSNITKRERVVLKNLKNNKDIIIARADKGHCIVIMDRLEYLQKMETKLSDTTTYVEIHEDPTYKIQEELS